MANEGALAFIKRQKEEEEEKKKRGSSSANEGALAFIRKQSGYTGQAPAAPQPSTETPAQTGRLRPGWDVSDVVREASNTADDTITGTVLRSTESARTLAAATKRFGGMTTDELFSYVPTDERDRTLYQTYMDSRTRVAESLDKQSKRAENDAARAGNDAEAYREFLGMPGASDEEIFGLAQAIRENNAQARSLEPQRWLEYAEGLQQSQQQKQALTAQGVALANRAAAANEQGQMWEYSNIIGGYGELINSPDFEKKSQYAPTGQSLSDITKRNVYDSQLTYRAINGDREAQDYILRRDSTTSGFSPIPGDSQLGYRGGKNDYLFELTDTEKSVYNALYASSPKAASDFVEKLKPYLEVRARDSAQTWASFMAQRFPVLTSLATIPAGVEQSREYLTQIGDLIRDGKINQNSANYRASQMTSTVRGEVSKKIEDKWGKAGSAAYNIGMSMGDFLFGTAAGGGTKALSLALMGTRAAASTVLNLKDRGLDDTAAFTLGSIAGAAEIITESFSLEKLLNPNLVADGIAKNILKNFLAEASEEGAADVLNWAAEYIYDAITGNNEAEWKQKVYDAIQNGADPNDAVLAAIQDNLVQLGMDMLSGGISGGLMSAAGTPFYLNNFNASQQGQYANAIRGNEEAMQALIQQGLESPQNTESYQLAQAALKQFADGKTPSTLNIARLVEANQQQINNETAEQSGQGRFRLTLPRTTPQNAPTPEQVETLRQIGAPLPTGVNTAQEAPPVPQETRNTPGLTLPARTTQSTEGAAEAPRLTLPTQDTQAATEAPPTPSAEQVSAFDEQAESDLVERLSKSKPGLMVDDYARSKLSDAEIQAIDETAKRLGLRVGFVDLGQLKDSNAKIYDNGVVLIEKGNPNPIGYLYGHEMSHWLQQNSPEAYNEFAEAARAAAPEWFKYREEKYNTELRKMGKEMSPEEIQEEILCDYAGWLVKDEDVLNRFISQNKDKPNVLRRLYEAIKALAAKLTGRERQQANTAADLLLRAMNATEANVQNGIMSTGETRGSFGGILAQYADMEAQERAEDLHTRGNRTRERGPVFNNYVRKKTGWFKGGDGMWRFEIDDHNSSVSVDESMRQLRDDQYNETANLLYRWNHNLSLTSDEWDYVEDYLATSDEDEGVQLPSGKAQKFASGHGTIRDVLEHKELYRQYPFIATVPLKFEKLDPTTLGSTTDSGITLNTSLLSNETELRSTLLHEIQHLIQREEGFARGSNPGYWQSQIDNGMDTTRPSEVNALKEYNRIKAENPGLVRDVLKVTRMFEENQDQYRYVDADTWEDKKTGELIPRDEVWGEYDKLTSEMESEYGDALNKYYDVLATLGASPEEAEVTAITGPGQRSAREMYENTYGEEEARNVEFRARLNPEAARDMPPFTGDEDSVFVEPELRTKSSTKGLDADAAPESIRKADSDYLAAVESGEEWKAERMVRDAALSWGAETDGNGKPLDLYHGTPRFGFTAFDMNRETDTKGMIYATTRREVAANYAGRDHYAGTRPVGKRFIENASDVNDIIQNAKSVYQSDYHVMTDAEKTEVRNKVEADVDELLERYNALTDRNDLFQWDDEDYSFNNALAWVEDLFYTVQGNRENFDSEEEYRAALDDDLERFERNMERVRDYLREHSKELRGNSAYRFLTGYDMFDLYVDLAHSYQKVISGDELIQSTTGNIQVPAELQAAMENIHNIGAYHLYGNLGDNPVTIDAQDHDWLSVQAPEIMGDDKYHSTDAIAKKARDRGYTGVVIKNVYDGGNKADDYIFFNANQVKSADPVTYYDNGDIIPLSERFNPENPDIRYSLKGLNADIAPESIQKYGKIPKGEKPARDINVPRKVTDKKNERVSWTARTALEAKATPDAAIPAIAELVEKGAFSYQVQSDKAAIADAEATIKDKGWSAALADWVKDVTKGNVNKANTAMGWALYNNAANAGDLDTALTVLDLMVQHQRNAAQALQASRILKQLSPEAQLYGVQRSVDNLVRELQERYGKRKNIDIQINRDLAQAFLDAKTEEERSKALEALYKDIGRQVPATFRDKWNAWRYLAMLANPRTHIRNISGNLGFAPVVFAKDQVATVLEGIASAVSKGKVERTKGLVLPVRDHDLVKAAWDRYQSVRDEALGGGKYNDSQMANRWIEEGRTIFKFKPLELARRGNSAALDAEDVWFSQPHYTYALAQYCKANGITPAQIRSGEGMGEADAYAIKEAQKATYRDINAFSDFVSSIGRTADRKTGVGKAASAVLEGVLPFRRTPANILVRGLEYSPFGLLKSLTYDISQVMRKDADGNPRMSVAEMLDDVSAGLTGTGLLALGGLLAKLGLLRGHGEDEKKERDYYDLMGFQNYALTLPNGESYTLDWLAPESLPLFVGVNIYEQLQQSKGDMKMSDLIDVVSQISEPMLEMSMLQSLNDMFESVGYAKENELSALTQVLSSAATSYLTQAIPTLLGQGERTGENLRMTTYTDKNNKWLTKSMQYTLGKISAKVPGWDYGQVPYIDAWGRTEETGKGWVDRAFKNMVNPAYTDKTRMSDMEAELLRLYNVAPDKYGSVLPSRPDKYIKTSDDERIDMTGEQYVAYATTKGQTAYNLLTELVKTETYKNASDEDKAAMVASVYGVAGTVAKGELLESLGKPFEEYEKLKGRIDAGADVLDTITLKQELKIADEENNANSSKDTLEKLTAVEALGLPEAKAEPLLEQQLSEGQWEKYSTLKDADVNYDTRLDIMRKYSELNANEEMDSGTRALEFAYYVDGLNLTGKQTQLVKDTYKFWTQVPAEAKRYETTKLAGLSNDKAMHVAEVLGAIKPLPGKEDVTDIQRYRAIESDKTLTNAEKIKVIGSIMGTAMTTEKGNPSQWAKFNTALNNGRSLSQAIDLCESGRLDEFVKWTESAAKAQKVTWDVYDTFLKETAKLDGKENGVSVNGLLKKRVVAYIDSLNLTPEQKDALLTDYNSTYKHDVTWHSGSYGSSSGSGRTYARANLSRLELPRTNTRQAGRLTLPTR